jgi:hypothetical protein
MRAPLGTQESALKTTVRRQEWYDFPEVGYRSGQNGWLVGGWSLTARTASVHLRDSPSDRSDTKDGMVYDAQKREKRRNGMAKTTAVDLENFDRFMRAMARMIGVSRKRLDRIMFQGREVPVVKRSRSGARGARPRLVVK